MLVVIRQSSQKINNLQKRCFSYLKKKYFTFLRFNLFVVYFFVSVLLFFYFFVSILFFFFFFLLLFFFFFFIYINIYTHTHKHASCMEYIIVRIFLDLGKKSSHMAFLLHFFIRQSYVQMR